jgi:hypothetical protein
MNKKATTKDYVVAAIAGALTFLVGISLYWVLK